jgi:hypothetical protein
LPPPAPVAAPPAAIHNSAPCPAGSSWGWSASPRSAWDFGTYPPYYR